ncbi:MAG: Ig-like domain-containing protein [Oscillospiraceae bacterium]|nr:Ig-like domain-containing protein [Oscillospiraceae bacterium]
MNGKIKRLLAMLLACVFCMSLLPEIAFAAEPEKFEIDFTQVEKTTLYEYTTGAYYINNTKTGSSYNYSAMRKSGGNGVEWSVLLEKADSPILAKANAVRFFPGNSDVRGMYMMFYNSHIAADQDAVTVEFEVPVTGVYDMLIDAAYDYLGGIGSFYVDGAQMGGDIDFYTASSTTTLKQDVPVAGKVSLTAGTHKLRIKGNHQSKTDVSVVGEDAKNKNAANIDIRKVTFAPRGGVASVEASCNTNYMLLGNTNGVQLSVSAKYRSGFNVDIANDAEVEFTSSDENIALVSDAGVVTPVSAGDVEITVRVTGGDSITPASDTVKLAVVDTGASERFEVDFTQVDQSTLYEYKAGAYYLTSNKIEGQTFSAARKSDGDGVEWNILLTKADSPILAKNTGVRFFPANNDVRGMYIMFYNGNIDDGQGALSFEFTAPETGLYDVLIDAAYQDLGGIAKFYIDGMPMGEEIDFYITETDAKLREGVPVAAQMYITEGKHKIRIEAKKQPKTESGTKAANIDIRKFIFSPRGGVASAELKYDKKFILLDDADGEKLNLFAKYESGFDVDVENEAAVSFASSDDTIATVTDKGVVMPVSLGNVVITAKIAAGESDVPATAEFALTVSNEPIYDGFVVDFTNQTAETAYQATIETNGWEFNREKSDAYLLSTRDGTDVSRYSTYGLLLQPGSTEQRNQISIDFLVPSSGNYDIEFSGKTGANGGAASLYIDGKFVGTYDFYTIDDLTNVRKKLRSLYLTGGEKHTLTFRAPDEGPNWMQFTPTSVTFTGTEALTPVIGAGAERTRNSIAVGESEEFELYFIQRNGAEWFVREPIFGTDTVSAEMTVGNTEIADVDGNLIRARAPGNVTMSIAGEIDGEPVADSFTFNVNENTYDHAEIDVVYDIFYEGGQTEISASAYLSDGSLINARDIEYTFSTSDEGKAIVDENNILHTNNEGTVTVIAHVTFNGDTLDASTEINIVPVALERIEAKTEDAIVSMRDNDGSRIVVTGVNNDGSANALDGAIFKYENLSPEIIEVTDNGYVFPVQRGSAQVKVSAFLGGLEFSCTADVVSSSQKTEPTIYTYEMRENALENIKKYSWAKEARDAAVESADKWVEKLDALYGMITYEGFPRANTIGLREDQEAYNCVYCGLDIRDKYGWYGWIINPLSRKWKIQCPECKRLFPSNDFESFYELGLDQKGQFDRLRALEAHRAMLLAQGKIDTSVAEPGEEWSDEWCAYYGYGQGYLENTAYKDVNKTLGIAGNKVSTWAVDDGFGWDTGEVMPSGLPVKKAFIAQYHHYIYYKSDSADSGIMKTALNAIRDAYLYTGDMKYGRAGAILIDRIADVYPSFNRSLHPAYQNSDGETFAGKILGSIWEHEIANVFVRAYDAFYPAMEDPQVIAYLSAKAEEFGLENPKTNANMIRENCEDGVVREVGAAVKRAQVRGNHGMHQSVMTLAAVALDTFPETAEMLDWLSVQERFGITTSTQYGQSYRTRSSNAGGSILHYLVNEVDRDGFGWEIGADYNQGWLMNQRTIAETLYHYGKYDKLNLYENAKFRKMFDSTINT